MLRPVSDKSDCAVVFREGRVAGHHGGPLVAAIPAESFLEFLRMYVPGSEHFLIHWEAELSATAEKENTVVYLVQFAALIICF